MKLLAILLLAVVLPLTSSAAQPSQEAGSNDSTFATDQVAINQALNDFWGLQGLGRTTSGVKANWAALLGSSDWYEWNSLKLNWSSDADAKVAQRDLLLHANITGINATGAQAAGYVWPSNGSEFWLCPHPHFDQMPRFICAVYNDYVWSRDLAFLQKMQPALEAVMGYMTNTMPGRNGLLICPDPYTGLSPISPNVSYMDCYREGGAVTWIEEGYYTALQDMAVLETVLGRGDKGAGYAVRAQRLRAQFDAQLWNRNTRRYAGWKDGEGTLHDYGFTYSNLEALARGMGNASRAYDIFNWLDQGSAQPTVMGGHVGSRDIYQCVVAPRSNTIAIPPADWDPWSVPETLRRSTMGYGALVEDGGALLWVNYYDVMARLKWLDADSAWDKFTAMLYRIAGDELLFTEDVHHPTNDYGENYLEVGPADGPENGINATAPLYGFMGVEARTDGLYASPNLPTVLLSLAIHNVNYGSASCDVRVSRGKIVSDVAAVDAGMVAPSIPLTAATTQVFTAPSHFNVIGVALTHRGASTPRVQVRLQKRHGAAWLTAGKTFVEARDPDSYCYVYLPVQSPGTYAIVLTPVTGMVSWHQRDGRYACRAAYEPVRRTAMGVLNGATVAFKAAQSFSRIALQPSGTALGTVTLWRQLGEQWRRVESSWTTGNEGGTLSFADQPRGAYQLRFARAGRGIYYLLSHDYEVCVTNGAVSTTKMVAAEGTVRLNVIAGAPIGHRIAIFSPVSGHYVSSSIESDAPLLAHSATMPGAGEVFRVHDAGNGNITLESEASHRTVMVSASHKGALGMQVPAAGTAQTFLWQNQISGQFSLYSPTAGHYVSTDIAHDDHLTTGFATVAGTWEQFAWTDLGTY